MIDIRDKGRKYLPKFTDIKGWISFIEEGIDNYPTIGGIIIFSIAAGISGLKDPSVCFKDLVIRYALVNFIIGILVALGILWIPG